MKALKWLFATLTALLLLSFMAGIYVSIWTVDRGLSDKIAMTGVIGLFIAVGTGFVAYTLWVADE